MPRAEDTPSLALAFGERKGEVTTPRALAVGERKGEWQARRCLVLGGSGALGRAVCASLASRGVKVALTYHRHAPPPGEGVTALPLDLADVAAIAPAIDAAASSLGGLDALIDCAAIGLADSTGDGPLARLPVAAEIDEAGWDRVQAVNVKGAFFACRAAIPHLTAAGGGNIVLVGSVDSVKSAPSPAHYAASKGALRGLVLALSQELGPVGVRVNLVAPGLLGEGLSRRLPEALRRDYVAHSAARRVGRAAEVAAVIAHLAVDNTYINGQTLAVDGAL